MRSLILQALQIIKRFEGLSLKPYICPAGIPTIGYGSTRYADGKKVTMQDQRINDAIASSLLLHETQRSGVQVLKMSQVSLDDYQYGALVSFVYNLGSGRLRSSTLLKKLNRGDYAGAADEFPKWCFAGRRKLSGLVARRKAERALFKARMR